MKHHTMNVGDHMVRIKQALDVPGSEEDTEEVERKEGLLDELLDIVENIDHAKGWDFPCISCSRHSCCIVGVLHQCVARNEGRSRLLQ